MKKRTKDGLHMSLIQDWRETAYASERSKKAEKLFWDHYFAIEKSIYEQLLENPSVVVTGTVDELAKRYNTTRMIFVGFLDGINESLHTQNPLETLEADTQVSLDFDLEKLYYHMVEAKADWLYTLPAWETLLSEERRKELYREQKHSGTVQKERRIGRNSPCPCGSGKKYKYCCGR